jgi:hypothetical protein
VSSWGQKSPQFCRCTSLKKYQQIFIFSGLILKKSGIFEVEVETGIAILTWVLAGEPKKSSPCLPQQKK